MSEAWRTSAVCLTILGDQERHRMIRDSILFFDASNRLPAIKVMCATEYSVREVKSACEARAVPHVATTMTPDSEQLDSA